MGKYTGVKGKITRRFGVNLFGNMKYDKLLAKRPTPPGQHGEKSARKKQSEYGRQLDEKQKLKITYGLREKQFKNLFVKATKIEGITGNNLVTLLEQRLDNVVYRMGWATSRSSARQLVSHGHIKVNGSKLNIPSYSVKIGDEITSRSTTRSKALLNRIIEENSRREAPEWISVSNDELKGKILRQPADDEIQSVADVQLIVELYSK